MLGRSLIRFYKKKIHQFFLVLLVFLLWNHQRVNATPQLNFHDPAIIHTIYGTDKFYKELSKAEFSLHFAPLYKHTSTASQHLGDNFLNGTTNKVPAGNRLGRWNMLALMYNPADPIPSTSPLGKAKTNILAAELAAGTLAADSVTEQSGKNFSPDLSQVTTSAPVVTTDKSTAGTIERTDISFEQLGLRGQMSFDFAFGLGMTVKGGVVDYRQTPKFTPYVNATTTGSTAATNYTGVASTVFNELTPNNKIEAIAAQFGVNIAEQRLTTFEDTHISLHWSIPFKRYDTGDYSYTLVPFFSIGAWVPTGEELDQNKAFSLATGNQGFAGGTVEVSLNFEFPKMLQIGFGGGAAFYGERTLTDQRVPTSELQVGIIPWKTSITKRPGTVWYFNLSMKSENFEPGFSFYGDYIFTQHTRDSIELNECNPLRAEQFEKGVEMMRKVSAWKAQHFNFGIKYDITSMCALSLGIQGYINGIRAYRVTTVLGSFTVNL